MGNITKDFYKFAASNTKASPSVVRDVITKVNNQYINPNILEERNLNVAVLDVFSRLMMDRIIFLGTDVNEYSANVVQAQLLYLDSADDEKDINIYINSPGGSVYDGLGIYDTMQYIKCDVSTTCIGLAASMGSVLLAAGAKGKRYALPHSRVMIHQPMGGVPSGTQASDMEIEMREMNKLKKELYEVLSEHTGQTYKRIEKDADRDHWFRADEAVEYGLIDSVLRKSDK